MESTSLSSHHPVISPRHLKHAFWTALVICAVPTLGFEASRLATLLGSEQPLVEWMVSFNPDVSAYAYLLLGIPVALVFCGRTESPALTTDQIEHVQAVPSSPSVPLNWWMFLILGVASIGVSLLTSSSIPGNPPAYHDEYSYLFQAQTYARGRLVNSSFEQAPQLFDQMHVLNQNGRFVSRYFPMTGFWMLPFVMLGVPHWSPWLATALSTMLIARAGELLGGRSVGMISGVLMVLCPGIVLFGQLLLSHHVCLLALSLFLVSYLTAERNSQHRVVWHTLAAVALAAAMLCRPMTALGFSLPFGIALLLQWTDKSRRNSFIGVAISYAVPICLGLGLLGICNKAATDDYFTTAYSRYTQLHTPRHVYGFYNRSRGEASIAAAQQQGTPLPVQQAYDEWALELTPQLAARNVFYRLVTSWQWMMGLFCQLFVLLMALTMLTGQRSVWWLIILGLLCLHLVHVPYWFDGIFHWHYVFETTPLWMLLTAMIITKCFELFRQWQRSPLIYYLLLFPGFAMLSSYVSLAPLWEARYWIAMSQIEFTQTQFSQLNSAIDQLRGLAPALVVVTEDPGDVHTDYVVNEPSLQASVLKVHDLRPEVGFSQLQQWFPDRTLIHYDQQNQQIQRIQSQP